MRQPGMVRQYCVIHADLKHIRQNGNWDVRKVKNIFATSLVKQNGETVYILETSTSFGEVDSQYIAVYLFAGVLHKFVYTAVSMMNGYLLFIILMEIIEITKQTIWCGSVTIVIT